MVIACIELCRWFLICKFDNDSCGACVYERCLFFVMIIWWMIGDKHVYVMLFVEHVKCWLLVVNPYMLILMVILLVNACMQNEGDIGYYIQCFELFVWTYALLLSHMFMHTWLMVMILYIWNDDDYDVFVASKVTTLLVMVPHASRSV